MLAAGAVVGTDIVFTLGSDTLTITGNFSSVNDLAGEFVFV